MPTNIHVYPSVLTNESRILRSVGVIETFPCFDQIIVFGIADANLPAEEHVSEKTVFRRLARQIFLGKTHFLAKMTKMIDWSFRVYREAVRRDVVCINAHSLAVLPLCAAIKARTGALLIYDAHELETEVLQLRGLPKMLMKLVERSLIRFVDETIVVSDSIGAWYKTAYGLNPVVVRNMPAAPSRDAIPVQLRKQLGLGAEDALFLFQGAFVVGRGVERLLKIFSDVGPRLHICFLGSGALLPLINEAAARRPNIHYVPGVPPGEVLHYTREADVGVSLTEKSCLSHDYSLPNKIFEYLVAGIPIIVPALHEQRRLVESAPLGWVLSDDDATASKFLATLTPEEIGCMAESVRQVRQQFSWDHEKEKLIALYQSRIVPRLQRDGKC